MLSYRELKTVNSNSSHLHSNTLNFNLNQVFKQEPTENSMVVLIFLVLCFFFQVTFLSTPKRAMYLMNSVSIVITVLDENEL